MKYIITYSTHDYIVLWQYGLWSFQTGGTQLERFLPKNQHTQRKLLSFENWVNGEVSKTAKIWLSKSKSIRIFLNFFSLKNTNLGALTFLLTFFDKLHFLKSCLIFDSLPQPILKIQSFPLDMLIFRQKYFQFFILRLKTRQPALP